MAENNDMRETLQNMQTELINLLNQQNNDYESNTEVRKSYLLPILLFSLQVFHDSFQCNLTQIVQFSNNRGTGQF